MEPIMPRLFTAAAARAALVALVGLIGLVGLGAAPGCRLDPLVTDDPGASANLLPSTAQIPSIATNTELTTQITLNDGLDSTVLAASGGVIGLQPNGTAMNGPTTSTTVSWWAFGRSAIDPAPVYVFGTGAPTTTEFKEIDHPPMVDVVPGDSDYQPIHAVFRVQVTDKYAGQRITTPGALTDAIDLGLVEPPVAIKKFVNWPIVRPGTRLQVGGSAGTAAPRTVYAHGYMVDSYVLGGDFSLQDNPSGLLPSSQVSFLRKFGDADYDRTRPVFQALLPTPAMPNYTPVSIVVKVDLTASVVDPRTMNDATLFTRSAMTGQIMTARTENVLNFVVTSETLDLQIQFVGGMP
jgi:hypothetical protein